MFPLKKLRNLSFNSRIRKIALILQKNEIALVSGKEIDTRYLEQLFKLLKEYKLPNPIPKLLDTNKISKTAGSQEFVRFLNCLRHSLLTIIGAEPAEWDFINTESGTLAYQVRKIFPFRIYIEEIRSPYNVGAIFRTAEAFGVEHIYLSPDTPLPTHKRAQRTARGCEEIIPWSIEKLSAIKQQPGIFALEMGGVPLDEFSFPESGIVLVGSEELGLSPEALQLARSKLGLVTIPLAGAKRSLNVSVAFGILMQKWFYTVVNSS